MNAPIPARILNQHLIDPEVCIRCNTCEETCPIDAITHDDNNYVVDASICQACMACVPPCPTGAVDSWIKVLTDQPYTLEQQFSWDELPAPQALPDEAVLGEADEQKSGDAAQPGRPDRDPRGRARRDRRGAEGEPDGAG